MLSYGYENFKATVLNRLYEDIPTANICVHPTIRNNGEELDILTIREGGVNIGPVIYLQKYYNRVVEGMPFEKAYEQIIASYEQNKTKRSIDTTFFTDFERIQSKIYAKVVNTERNEKLLANVPNIPFLDLSITFYVGFDVDEDVGTATIQIDNSHLALWNVTTEELLGIAMQNMTGEMAPHINDINSILDEIIDSMGEMGEKTLPKLRCEPVFPIYVLTNKKNLFGAAAIINKGLLASYADRLSMNFYILPSSVHEVILVPADENDKADDFSMMVRSVNETHVEPEDVLADHAYYYNRNDGEIVMCA